MGYKYAVVGATGNVGREIMNILSEREVLAVDVTAVASSRSVGMEVVSFTHPTPPAERVVWRLGGGR